jgi:hypothetical protein
MKENSIPITPGKIFDFIKESFTDVELSRKFNYLHVYSIR